MRVKNLTQGGFSDALFHIRYLTHFGHKVITKYRSQFNSIEEHDQAIFDNFSKLKKRDIVWVLGDIIFDSPKYEYYLETLRKMSCEIRFVLGNHDSLRLYEDLVKYNSNLKLQLPFFSYKNYWISHCPIHPQEMRGRFGNICGHLHKDIVWKDDSFGNQWNDTRYYNVGLDTNNFKFVDFEYIQSKIK